MIENDFESNQKEILLSFIKIYNSIEVDIQGEKISPTKGGPQGSSIIPILFCYYLDNCINKIKLRENIILQAHAYADDLIIQATSIKDLKDTYIDIKENLIKYHLIINQEKCELLTDNKLDTIIDEDSGIEISMKETVKYLGQQINHKGISEQLIEDKIFGKIKKILFNNNYLTRFSRIRIFKCYMFSKISHLLPLISLKGHLSDCWKCIRRIIFRNILKAQTSPLETAVTLGIGYYNLIIRPLIKLIEKYKAFNNNTETYKFLQSATIKAFAYWKNLEQKLPEEVEIKLNRIINNNEWILIEEIDALIYRNISTRLFRNCKNIKQIKDLKALKYPNYIYLLSNASTHEISDTIVTKENTKDYRNKKLKWERYTQLIKMTYASYKFLVLIIKEKNA